MAMSEYGEVIVDLHQIRARGDPRADNRQLRGLQRECRIHQQSQIVGEDQLLAEAHHKPLATHREVRQIFPAIGDFLGHRLIAHDGTGNQLREEGDVQADANQVLLHLSIAPVHVDDIAHRLEREKRYANGQCDFRHRKLQAKPRAHVGQQERQIFEHAQHPQIVHDHQRHGDPGLPPVGAHLVHPEAKQPVEHNGEQHDKHKRRLSPCIEQQAHNRQEQIGQLAVSADQIISRQNDRQKIKKKDLTRKYHLDKRSSRIHTQSSTLLLYLIGCHLSIQCP